MSASKKPNMRGHKSCVDLMPVNIKQVLITSLENNRLPYRDISKKMAALGFSISKSAIGRYAVKLRYGIVRLNNAGVSMRQATVHKDDFHELSWLLLEREIIGQKCEENAEKIKTIKEKIPFFDGEAGNE